MVGLSEQTTLFRSTVQIEALDKFFIEHASKAHVLRSMEEGFRSQFEYPRPPPWGHVQNYPPLLSTHGQHKLREAMKIQVLQGKMIGGPG